MSLDEYNFGDIRYQVAVLAIELAMDHKPSNREMTSILLSDLYERFLSERDIEKGEIETGKKSSVEFHFICAFETFTLESPKETTAS